MPRTVHYGSTKNQGTPTDQTMTRHRLSAHFTVEEFDCHDGTRVSKRDYDGLEYLCKTFLEPLRSKYGPVKICSGFRTAAYNKRVGGVSNSFHRYDIHDGNDQAADVGGGCAVVNDLTPHHGIAHSTPSAPLSVVARVD